MKLHQIQLNIISVLAGTLVFLYIPPAFAKSNDVLVFKIACEDTSGLSEPQNSNECKQETLIIDSADIQCITPSIENSESLTDFFASFSDKPSKTNQPVNHQNENKKVYSINFSLTKSAGDRLSQFTEKNIGRILNIFYKHEMISNGIIQSKFSSNFQVTETTENEFNQIMKKLGPYKCPKADNTQPH